MREILLNILASLKWLCGVCLIPIIIIGAFLALSGPFWLACEFNNGFFMFLYLPHAVFFGAHLRKN